MINPFQDPPDATPLDPALRRDLIQTWVTTRADLNEAEQENIVKGTAWARHRRGGADALLKERFSKNLHRQMFGEVWKWAGSYRRTELNIGIAPHLIAAEMPVMFDNARYWVDHETFPPDEVAMRLHHRLTQIHGFPNGNGRHARMMADLLIDRLGGPAFTWGSAGWSSGAIRDAGTLRTTYVQALRAADQHDVGPLIAFARS